MMWLYHFDDESRCVHHSHFSSFIGGPGFLASSESCHDPLDRVD